MFRKSLGMLCFSPFGACDASVQHPPYTPQATTALTAVESVPPPGRIERIPDKPTKADAWVDGEWILRRGRWYWLLGRWVTSPPGALYSPWVVVRAYDGHPYYAPSIWRDAKGSPLAAPPALAYATANGQAVFDAEGDHEDTGRSIKLAPTRRVPRPGQTAP
ncbi:MAG: hypothetical protein M3O46_01500 [Myxococcota bacterium]|nr:hypothetical protein [Myxococcota bacterium]